MSGVCSWLVYCFTRVFKVKKGVVVQLGSDKRPPFIYFRDRRGSYCMVVRFITTYVISAYHRWCCKFESRPGRGVQHYAIKFVSELRQVGCFLRVLRFPPTIKLTATIIRYNWNIVESGSNHHQTNKQTNKQTYILCTITILIPIYTCTVIGNSCKY